MTELIVFIVSLIILIVFFVMASNIGTIVKLLKDQNIFLANIQKLNEAKRSERQYSEQEIKEKAMEYDALQEAKRWNESQKQK